MCSYLTTQIFSCFFKKKQYGKASERALKDIMDFGDLLLPFMDNSKALSIVVADGCHLSSAHLLVIL
jgi:hypothetical protein